MLKRLIFDANPLQILRSTDFEKRRAITDHTADFQKIVAKLTFNVKKIESQLENEEGK